MKFLTIIIIFVSTTLYAAECPVLTGQYHCTLSDGTYSLLIISQQTLSSPSESELEQYSFDYTAIPGDADVIEADTTGIPDSFGYTNRCTENRLLSIATDGSSLSELYLDNDGALVNTFNGSIISKCPRRL